MTVITMPSAAEFVQCAFSLQYNTQTFTSPLSRSTQTLEVPGARWGAAYQVTIERGDVLDIDDKHGEWKSFLAKCRGGANRFWGYDPNHRKPRGMAGQGVAASRSYGDPVTPSASLTPGAPLVPRYEGFGEVSGTDNALIKEAVASGNVATISGLVSWDYSQGVNALIESAYYFKPGDYIQVGNELKMVTDYSVDDKQAGECTVVFEPPIRIPFVSNQVTVLTNPACLMRLVDDGQANWSMTAAHMHHFSFSGVESFV